MGESGIISFYGNGEIPPGALTANGEVFDRHAMTAAHKTLPFNTWIRVKNLENGKTVNVRINDRGPYAHGRILDLTYGAFGVIANHGKGLINGSYRII